MQRVRHYTIKPLLFIGALFILGIGMGQFWHFLGDKDNLVNRYLEAHNSRLIGDAGTNQIYYVFYDDFIALSNYVEARSVLHDAQTTSIETLATISIDQSSLPDSLDLLRQQAFIRFIFPGTFPFICH